MQIMPIDLVSLVGTILGISIVLVPVIGITARFALSPTVEALSNLFDSRSRDESLRIMERRLELQEQEIAMLTQAVRSLAEGQDFDRKLLGSDAAPVREPAAEPGGADPTDARPGGPSAADEVSSTADIL